MIVIDSLSRREYPVEILRVEQSDFEFLQEDRYFFDWIIEQNEEVYKLQIAGSIEVLGLISLERFPIEWRIHIRLLTVSKENKGKGKRYENICGNLITHAAKLALMEFGELACVSLRPKTEIVQHYVNTYNMNLTGLTLSVELPEILNLINLYDHD